MFEGIKAGCALVVAILVIQLFLPEVGMKLVELIVKILDIMLVAVNSANSTNVTI